MGNYIRFVWTSARARGRCCDDEVLIDERELRAVLAAGATAAAERGEPANGIRRLPYGRRETELVSERD